MAPLIAIFAIWIAFLLGLIFYVGGKLRRLERRFDERIARLDADLARHTS